jgi:hypothetical protein
MLISASDYKVLIDNIKMCMPVVRANNGSNLLIDPQIIQQPCREAIMMNRCCGMSKCIDDKDYIIKCNNVIVGDASILTNAISDDASECIKQ